LTGVTILHEFTHYGDDQDGEDIPGEEGEHFEKAVYGKVVTEGNANKIIKDYKAKKETLAKSNNEKIKTDNTKTDDATKEEEK